MALPIVYIETSIPSFYYETRTEPDMVARREWTRQWWDVRRVQYQLVTSQAVLDELARGDYPTKRAVLSLVADLPILPVEPPVPSIVAAYLDNTVMPRDPTGDALHLALAAYHGCDFLLTWNCNHLANANKFVQIRRVTASLGYEAPTIATPLELLGGAS